MERKIFNFGWENFEFHFLRITCFNNAIMKSSFCSAFAFSVINTYSMHNSIVELGNVRVRERNLMLLLLLVFTVSAACSASVHPFQTNSGVDQFNQASAN
ncbi:hypothetical protein T4D_2508 [Trichinella pseudospiralis]|uniref:Uncharacterized protein n=1 Tax=Trichinella pseudospiralis TaxID=6337 RepID=A0A0V1FSG0_TRIPS|nr:hypothetical protein T4D_2508 [Trichinella pseudospiralis]